MSDKFRRECLNGRLLLVWPVVLRFTLSYAYKYEHSSQITHYQELSPLSSTLGLLIVCKLKGIVLNT